MLPALYSYFGALLVALMVIVAAVFSIVRGRDKRKAALVIIGAVIAPSLTLAIVQLALRH